jgi:hypothetical protein
MAEVHYLEQGDSGGRRSCSLIQTPAESYAVCCDAIERMDAVSDLILDHHDPKEPR